MNIAMIEILSIFRTVQLTFSFNRELLTMSRNIDLAILTVITTHVAAP